MLANALKSVCALLLLTRYTRYTERFGDFRDTEQFLSDFGNLQMCSLQLLYGPSTVDYHLAPSLLHLRVSIMRGEEKQKLLKHEPEKR